MSKPKKPKLVPKSTFVTFVLDETGSMASIKDDTIGGFNEYLKTLQKSGEDIRFSLIKFDSNHTTLVCTDTAVAKVEKLTATSYQPGAATPLIDACVKAIKATEKKVGRKRVNVAVTIQTDGHENASTEYSREHLVALIKTKTKKGWVFTFLGAGIDAFAAAGAMGIAAANTMTYDRDSSGAAFASVASNTAAYAATGDAGEMGYSGQQRRATGGHMPPGETKKEKTEKPKKAPPKPPLRKVVDDITL